MKYHKYILLYLGICISINAYSQEDSLIYKCVDNTGRLFFSEEEMNSIMNMNYSHLDLSCTKIQSFPAGEYPSVNSLILNNTQILSYTSFFEFDNLKFLDIEGCILFEALLSNDFIAPNLEVLLGILPSEKILLNNYPNLRILCELDWSFTSKKDEVDFIESLRNSKVNRLELNAFELPDDSFFTLPLKALSISFISDVDMNEVVANLSQMPNLEELQIVCDDCEIPGELADLPFLRILTVHNFVGDYLKLPDSILYGNEIEVISLPTKGRYPDIPKTKTLISYFNQRKLRKKGWIVIDGYDFAKGVVE